MPATRRWLGAAAAVAQVSTVTLGGSIVAGDTFTIKIGNASLTYTAVTGDTPTLVAAGLLALCQGSTRPLEFLDVSFSNMTTVLTLTSAVAGTPFTLAVSKVSASGTIVAASVTAATGPNDFQNAQNWSGATVPVTGDTAVFQGSSIPCLYNLANSSVVLAELIIDASFEGAIGNPNLSDMGYYEYRATYLAIGATKVVIGQGDGRASSRIKLDLGTNASTVICTKTNRSRTTGELALQILAVHASTTITLVAGELGIANLAEEVSTISKITVGRGSTCKIGFGVTLATLISSGTTDCYSAVTTLTMDAGKCTVFDAAVTTATVIGGTFKYSSASTITTLTVGPGTLDLSGDTRARTISTCNMKPGGKIIDPAKSLTATGGIAFDATVDVISAA